MRAKIAKTDDFQVNCLGNWDFKKGAFIQNSKRCPKKRRKKGHRPKMFIYYRESLHFTSDYTNFREKAWLKVYILEHFIVFLCLKQRKKKNEGMK